MQSPIDAARSVALWTNFGVTLPKSLAESINLYEGVCYVEVGHAPTIDIETLTVANAEEAIRDLAQQLAIATTPIGMTGPQGQGPLERAKKQVLEQAARAVLNHASAAVSDIIAQMTPRFDQQANAYVAAVNQLPDEVTAEKLFQAGVGAVDAYQTAKSAVSWLEQVSSWVASTANLPGHVGNVDPALRVLRPSDPVQLEKLDAAHRATGVDRTLKAINPVFLAAAKNGVEFGINTLRECARIRQELKLTPSKIKFG